MLWHVWFTPLKAGPPVPCVTMFSQRCFMPPLMRDTAINQELCGLGGLWQLCFQGPDAPCAVTPAVTGSYRTRQVAPPLSAPRLLHCTPQSCHSLAHRASLISICSAVTTKGGGRGARGSGERAKRGGRRASSLTTWGKPRCGRDGEGGVECGDSGDHPTRLGSHASLPPAAPSYIPNMQTIYMVAL